MNRHPKSTPAGAVLWISAMLVMLGVPVGTSPAASEIPAGAVHVSVDGVVPVSESLPVAVSVSVAKSQAMRKALEQGGRVESRSESLAVNFELIKDVFDLNAEGLLYRQTWERFAGNDNRDWVIENGFVRVHLEAMVVPDIVQDDWKMWEKLMNMRGKPRFMFLRQEHGEKSGPLENESMRKTTFDAIEAGLRNRGMRFQDSAVLAGIQEQTGGGGSFRLPDASVLARGEYRVDYLIYAFVEMPQARVRSMGVRARKVEYDIVMACDIVDCSNGERISSQRESVTLGPYSNFSSGAGERGGIDPEAAFRADAGMLGKKIADNTYDRIMKDWSRLDNISTRVIIRGIRSDELLLLEETVKKEADGTIHWKHDMSSGNVAEIDFVSSMEPATVMALFVSQSVVPLAQDAVLVQGHEVVFTVARQFSAESLLKGDFSALPEKIWIPAVALAALLFLAMLFIVRTITKRK